MARTVFHIEVPDFAVSVERVRHRSLIGRPVLIATPGNARAQVLAASNEARQSGVVTGMRLPSAQRLCPHSTVLPPDRVLYQRATVAIEKLLGDFTPVLEPAPRGRFFLDMTGTTRIFGDARDSAAKLRKDIRQRLWLEPVVGISINKSVSRVASSVIHTDLLDVEPGSERPFLAPWEVRRLPGSGQVNDPGLFDELNIRKIGQLAGYAPGHLTMVFGKMGLLLNQRAQGIDPRPVTTPSRKIEVREEEILEADTNSRDRLSAHLFTLTERCGYRLRRLALAPRTVSLIVGYSDNLSLNGAARISPPVCDDGMLFAVVRKLLARVAVRRVRVRYLALCFTDLSGTGAQLSLFADRGRDIREKSLTDAMDKIRDRFGEKSIRRGVAA